MAEAAKMVESAGADILDINFGCSVKKVIKTGAGVALMKAIKSAETVLNAVRKATNIPLTIKIRTGWDSTGRQAVEISEMAEACNVDAIAVHPRTATQGFRGRADWSIISAVKNAVSIPVIGNGDISTPQDGLQMQKETGCDGIMIGRAAIGNPWIFSQYLNLIRGEAISPVNLEQRFGIMRRYVETSVKYIGEERACYLIRSRLNWFVKGMRFSSKFRESLKHISSEQEAYRLIDSYQETLLPF
jgi:nifR3 family TIM-barrel protein